MNLVILVLDSYTPNSIRNSKTQKKTWVKECQPYSEVLFYKGGTDTVRKGLDLDLECGDTYSEMTTKTLKALEWVDSNLPFDYIFRTNTSSYVNYPNLVSYLKKINKEKVDYCGFIGKHKDIEFVSGSGIILSKVAVKTIIENKGQLDKNLVEDVAIGKILKINKIFPIMGKRKDILSHRDLSNFTLDAYHIRCRLDPFGYSRNLETYVLRFIDFSFNQKKFFAEKIMIFIMRLNKLINKYKKIK
tara:strand:- start:778 stop:1512 length:735 start_codon:yes stop_codon:yes gene_type:complete